MVSVCVRCEKPDEMRVTLVVESLEGYGFAIFFVASLFGVVNDLQLLDRKVSIRICSLIRVRCIYVFANTALTMSGCAL
jgi:hypothetical protein